MYLSKFIINCFRGIKSLELRFNKGVNILIGENNAGKSTIIDAMRICLCYGSNWREISIEPSDFHVDKSDFDSPVQEVEFHLHFTITKAEEPGWFNDLLVVSEAGHQELQLHFSFTLKESNGLKKIGRTIWGGANEGGIIPSEMLDSFYFVYLEPLRDAVQGLKPIRGNKLGQLFHNLVPKDEERNELVALVKDTLNNDPKWKALIALGMTKINTHLKETSIREKEQQVNVDFIPMEFKKIVETLRILMPVFTSDVLDGALDKQQYFEISQNGLGYNNLLYTAVILGHLTQRAAIDRSAYIALFIEEPEAHLHPQLQNIFFKYLANFSGEDFQLFITSHSPTITAKANLDSLIVLQNHDHQISALSVIESELSPNNKSYLHKFLDVTKSQLFFASGVALVEGISEALLLPVFAAIMGGEFDFDKAGVEIVNINGVAFEHFAKLFNSQEASRRLPARCALITDNDAQEDEEETSRANNARDMEAGSLRSFVGNVTFEYELFIAGNNSQIMLSVYRAIKPKAAANIPTGNTIEEHAMNFLKSVKNNKAKSELANHLALQLSNGGIPHANFTIPDYIQQAIRWIIKSE